MENLIIKPISDLRTKLSEISRIVHETCKPVFLTKNGYGDMVIMSMDTYQKMVEENEIYLKIKESEQFAATTSKRLAKEEVFDELREYINQL